MPTTISRTSKYARYGQTRGFNPKPFEQLRMLAIGEPGRGKTEFLMNVPDCLVLDFDLGCGNIVHQKADFVPMLDDASMRSWVRTKSLIDDLISDKKKGNCPFKVIGIDTVDAWFHSEVKKLTEDYNIGLKPDEMYASCLDKNDKGATYRKLRDAIMIQLRRLADVGFGWICTSHIKRTTNEKGEIEEAGTLPPSTKTMLQGDCELIFRFDRRLAHPKVEKMVRGEPMLVPDTNQEKEIEYSLELSPKTGFVDSKLRIQVKESRLTYDQFEGYSLLKAAYENMVARYQEKLNDG